MKQNHYKLCCDGFPREDKMHRRFAHLSTFSAIIAVWFFFGALSGCQIGRSSTSDSVAATRGSTAPAQSTPSQSTPSLASRMSDEDRDVQIVQQVVPYQSRAASPGVVIRATAIEGLTPLPSGPGVVVCDPVAESSNAGLAPFGIACGRWLDLVVSGQPQFGRTPTWNSLARATHELHVANLCLNVQQAQKLGAILGVTDVAVGTMSGSPSRCTLTYQVYDLSSHSPVGRPISASGSEESVLDDLPGMARVMARQIGAASPLVPKEVNSAPAQMGTLGNLAWQHDLDLADRATVASLAKSAPNNPLGGMLYLTAIATHNETRTAAAARQLFAQLPGDPIPYAHLGQIDPIDLLPYTSQIDGYCRQFPNNSLYAATDAWLHRQDLNAQAERNAAERLVRDAPRNPDAWLTFASTIQNEAHAVRLGRWTDLISPSEEKYLDARYVEWYRACKIATDLDPNDGMAWLRLATAATFCGQSDADQYYQKALVLDDDQADVFDWGLQMYQPKWNGDPASLQQVAEMAAEKSYRSSKDILEVYDDLQDAGCSDQAAELLNRYEAAEQAKTASNPNDGPAHFALATCYAHTNQDVQAVQEYLAAAQAMPSDAEIYDGLGNTYDDMEQINKAIAAFQQAIHLDPDHKTAHYDLGFEWKRARHYQQAEQELKEALSLSPYYADAHYELGLVYSIEKNTAKAIPEFEAAVHCDPSGNGDAYYQLVYSLTLAHEYDKSIEVIDQGLLVGPENHNLLDELVWEYQEKHEYARSISVSNMALEVNPRDPYLHEEIAEDYFSLGNKAAAIAQWHQVVALGNSPEFQLAQSKLAKYQ